MATVNLCVKRYGNDDNNDACARNDKRQSAAAEKKCDRAGRRRGGLKGVWMNARPDKVEARRCLLNSWVRGLYDLVLS